MLSEEQYNKVKKLLKKSVKQYAIAEKLKISNQEVGKVKRTLSYEDYYIKRGIPSTVTNFTVPTQAEIPFYAPSTEDLYKLLIEIRDSVEELHARQGV